MKSDGGSLKKDDPVWEASVALALRDSQWLARPQKMVSPRSYIPLSSVPETQIGDALFPLADRYFIFELKGDRTLIPSEWKSKSIGGNEMPAKSAYRSLKRVFSKWLARQNDKTDPDPYRTIFQSLRGHHFVYWNDAPSQDYPDGNLVVEPYLRAFLTFPDQDDLCEMIDEAFLLGTYEAPASAPLDHGSITFAPIVSIQDVNHDRAVLAAKNYGETITGVYQLGLRCDEFKAYCDFLMETAKEQHHEIRVVVTNGDGSFARMMTNTNDFSALFSPDPSPRLELGHQVISPSNRRRGPRR